jgi:uncharacterized protein with HEPN domain
MISSGCTTWLIDGYFNAGLEIVGDILQDDLPLLITQLEQVFPQRAQPRSR